MLVVPFSRQSLGLLPMERAAWSLHSPLQRYINYLREKIEGRLNLINLLGFIYLINLLGFIYTQAQTQKFSLSPKVFYNFNHSLFLFSSVNYYKKKKKKTSMNQT